MNLRKALHNLYIAALTAGCMTILSGCTIIASPDDLFCLPKLPEEYMDLEQEIAGLVNQGYEYAAPTGGDNIQLVQMVDLDSDGADEAIVFLRKPDDLKPQKVCVFRKRNESFQTVATIEESAASISRVDYRDMNGDGNLEIIVGWQMMNVQDANSSLEPNNTERSLTRVVSVYNTDRYACEKVMETSYNQYILTDMDENGAPEMIVVAGGGTNHCHATSYQWDMGVMERRYRAPLSVPPAMLNNITVGYLSDHVQGLFVTGVIDETTLVTDILTLDENGLVNCTMDKQSGISRLIYRNSGIEAEDIDRDGTLELPIPYELKKQNPDDPTYWGITWTSFDCKGNGKAMGHTYHNPKDGWFLVLPESWKNAIGITDVSSTTGERAVTFGVFQRGKEAPLDVVTIYTETGDSREYKASKGNRFVLLRQSSTIYAAEFLDSGKDWSGNMTPEALKDGFHLIRSGWSFNEMSE